MGIKGTAPPNRSPHKLNLTLLGIYGLFNAILLLFTWVSDFSLGGVIALITYSLLALLIFHQLGYLRSLYHLAMMVYLGKFHEDWLDNVHFLPKISSDLFNKTEIRISKRKGLVTPSGYKKWLALKEMSTFVVFLVIGGINLYTYDNQFFGQSPWVFYIVEGIFFFIWAMLDPDFDDEGYPLLYLIVSPLIGVVVFWLIIVFLFFSPIYGVIYVMWLVIFFVPFILFTMILYPIAALLDLLFGIDQQIGGSLIDPLTIPFSTPLLIALLLAVVVMLFLLLIGYINFNKVLAVYTSYHHPTAPPSKVWIRRARSLDQFIVHDQTFSFATASQFYTVTEIEEQSEASTSFRPDILWMQPVSDNLHYLLLQSKALVSENTKTQEQELVLSLGQYNPTSFTVAGRNQILIRSKQRTWFSSSFNEIAQPVDVGRIIGVHTFDKQILTVTMDGKIYQLQQNNPLVEIGTDLVTCTYLRNTSLFIATIEGTIYQYNIHEATLTPKVDLGRPASSLYVDTFIIAGMLDGALQIISSSQTTVLDVFPTGITHLTRIGDYLLVASSVGMIRALHLDQLGVDIFEHGPLLEEWVELEPSMTTARCMICRDIIAEGETYVVCSYCNLHFHQKELSSWFNLGRSARKCPVCRNQWKKD